MRALGVDERCRNPRKIREKRERSNSLPRKPSRKRRRTAAANALIDNKAFGITSQVEAAVDATKNTASLNFVEMSSNECKQL